MRGIAKSYDMIGIKAVRTAGNWADTMADTKACDGAIYEMASKVRKCSCAYRGLGLVGMDAGGERVKVGIHRLPGRAESRDRNQACFTLIRPTQSLFTPFRRAAQRCWWRARRLSVSKHPYTPRVDRGPLICSNTQRC